MKLSVASMKNEWPKLKYHWLHFALSIFLQHFPASLVSCLITEVDEEVFRAFRTRSDDVSAISSHS